MSEKNFFIIGCQRSGTTFLYHLLEQHPQICMSKPVRPEPKYFIQQRQQSDIPNYINTYFKDRKPGDLLGEKSTSYIEHEQALTQIKSFFSQSKILIMMRNPVERAISNFFYSRNNGIEKREPEEAIFSENNDLTRVKSSVNPFDYLQRGHYSIYLERAFSIFGKELVKPIISEDLFEDKSVTQDIFDFLGVEENVTLKDRSVQNSSVKDEQVPMQVRERLYEHYQKEFAILKNQFGIQSERWHL